MSTTPDPLLGVCDEMRRRGQRLDLPAILAEAKTRGLSPTYADLRKLARSMPMASSGTWYLPEILPAFVSAYVGSTAPVSVLDPWAGIGEFINGIASRAKVSRAVAVTPCAADVEVARMLAGDVRISWNVGEPLDVLDSLAEKGERFDVIVGCPPFSAGPRKEIRIAIGARQVAATGFVSDLVILKAATLLAEDGTAFFVVPDRFFLDSAAGAVRNKLGECGAYLDAVFALPPGSFGPVTQIRGNLVALRRRKPDALFVAELSTERDPKPILANWKERKEGKAVSLGRLVEAGSFRSYLSLEFEERLKGLVGRSGLPPVPLADVAREINLGARNREEGFDEKPNAVYLPLIGTSEAVSGLSDLKIKPHNYAQIVLDEDRALAPYVARFFNSELGRVTREGLLSGFIPKLSKRSLSAAALYLPPVDVQAKAVEVQTEISKLRAGITRLETGLWENPLHHSKVRKALDSLNREQGFEEWTESLPFPLASILRRYVADSDVHLKNEHLLRFFEAVVEFVTAVMLSAFWSDKDYFEQNKASWFGSESFPGLENSSFGTWVQLWKCLAKTVRRELSSDEGSRQRCLRMFRRRGVEFLDAICHKKLGEAFDATCQYRNLWKGHGGIEGERVGETRRALLEEQLARVREVVADSFEGSLLVRTKGARFTAGVFSNKVDVLVGSNPIFKEAVVDTTVPLDTERLYLTEKGNTGALEVLPFVRIGPSPATNKNACYFYSRMVREGVRYVSYHFEDQPELIEPGGTLGQFVGGLREKSDGGQVGT